MSYQPYDSLEPRPKSGSQNRTILIIVGVVLALCCICTAVSGGVGAFIYWNRPKDVSNLPVFPTDEVVQATEEVFPFGDTPVVEDTPVMENTPEPLIESTPTLVNNQANPTGLGVSRDEMISFYTYGGAFKFGDVKTVQGMEMVTGEHVSLCVDTNCAAVTLGGPADDLLAVAVVVPTKPDDSAETTLGTLLLMTTAARFAGDQNADTVTGPVMEEILNAQKASQNLEKTLEASGYVFTVSYDAQTHNAGLLVTRPK